MLRTFAPLLAATMLGACAFEAKPAPVAAVTVFQSHDKKIPGRYALHVESAGFAKRAIKPDSWACSAHSFPVDIAPAFAPSVAKALEGVVEGGIVLTETPPSPEAMRAQRLNGIIRVRAETMRVQVTFASGFSTVSSNANAELTASVSADRGRGAVFSTNAEGVGTNTRERALASTCDLGAEALTGAAERALQRLVGTIAERLVNAPSMHERGARLRASRGGAE